MPMIFSVVAFNGSDFSSVVASYTDQEEAESLRKALSVIVPRDYKIDSYYIVCPNILHTPNKEND